MDAVGIGHVGLIQHHVHVGSYDADGSFELMADVVGEHAFQPVLFFGCLQCYGVFAFAVRIGLHAGVVNGYNLA